MPKPDYTEFDKALLAQIDAGRNTMMKLDSGKSGLLELAKPFCEGLTPQWRVIDRRLQALRKRGVIRFTGKEWVRAEKRNPI